MRGTSKPQGETRITSGSAATSASQVIQGECWRASPNRLKAPASATSSGIQLPAAISGSIHSTTATRGLACSAAAATLDVRDPPLEPPHQLRAALPYPQRLRDPLDVDPDVVEPVGLQREDARAAVGQLADGALDVGRADGADLALGLGDDEVGREALQQLGVHLVDREGARQPFLQGQVHGPGAAGGEERGAAHRREAEHAARPVALVRAADQRFLATQRADDLGAGGDQRHDARQRAVSRHGSGRSPGATAATARGAASPAVNGRSRGASLARSKARSAHRSARLPAREVAHQRGDGREPIGDGARRGAEGQRHAPHRLAQRPRPVAGEAQPDRARHRQTHALDVHVAERLGRRPVGGEEHVAPGQRAQHVGARSEPPRRSSRARSSSARRRTAAESERKPSL